MSQIDPRAPRFGQAITAALSLGAVLLQEPALVYVVATLLLVPVLSSWRIDPYGFLWKRVARSLVEPPKTTESPLPHRFARVVGAGLTGSAAILFVVATGADLASASILAYGLTTVVGLLATLGATTGFCLGCRMYRQVAFVRDLGVLSSPSE
ncbi:DUF4395 domain-containing protein [Halostagnicola bangensis]